MIFFSTLGGLLTFGLPGFIIGPIIAALFVTVWDIYGEEFKDWLPTTNFVPHSEKYASDNNATQQAELNDAEDINYLDPDEITPDQNDDLKNS